jgi:hypothetical protein
MSSQTLLDWMHPAERRRSGGAGTSHPRRPAIAATMAIASPGWSPPRGRGARQRMRRALWRHFGRYLEPRPMTAACVTRRAASRRVAASLS